MQDPVLAVLKRRMLSQPGDLGDERLQVGVAEARIAENRAHLVVSDHRYLSRREGNDRTDLMELGVEPVRVGHALRSRQSQENLKRTGRHAFSPRMVATIALYLASVS